MISRKDKSLGLLCHKFLARYPDYPDSALKDICLDDVATELSMSSVIRIIIIPLVCLSYTDFCYIRDKTKLTVGYFEHLLFILCSLCFHIHRYLILDGLNPL